MRLLNDLQWRNVRTELLGNWSVGSWRTQAELANYVTPFYILHYSEEKNRLLAHFKPLKMDLTEGSETSANINQTPGNHPKFDTVNTEHGESLKSRLLACYEKSHRKKK
jgi:hypothetical protein